MNRFATADLVPFFDPRGVALIGASANPQKLGHAILQNLTRSGYGGQVYPVNPRYQELAGLPCYSDIAAVPDPVDLAVTILPAPATPAVLEACGRRGLKAVTIISGGFKEVGPDGAALEEECVAIARRYGMRLIGPNGIGTINLKTGLNTTFLRGLPEAGPIAFLSQSGAVCGGVVDHVSRKHFGFSHFVSLGNEADVTETDILAYLGQDPDCRVITAYVEAIADGRRFMEVARQVAPQKPIVLLKAGRTEAGDRAVSSHTGALAGSHAAYTTAFHQSGVIEAFSISELFEIGLGLAYQPLIWGNCVAIVTNAGGPAALAADSLSNQGMCLAGLGAETQAALADRLDPSAQVGNPIDMLGGAEAADYEFGLQQALADPGVDVVLAIHVPQVLVNPADVAAAICRAAQNGSKPIFTCFMGEASVDEARRILHHQRVPMYVFPEAIGRVLGAMDWYRKWCSYSQEAPPPELEVNIEQARQILERATSPHSLGESSTRPLLQAYGIPIVAGQTARTPEEAAGLANQIGYPVALKVVSPDILHKSEVGGILLNLSDEPAVLAAYQQLMRNAALANSKARLEGVMVEAMAPKGHEVIVGVRRDPQFGPLVMFGLGGIYVEFLADVTFRVAPVSPAEALAMVQETKAGRLLSGLRGQEAGDIEAVVDCILRLSRLALDFPQIEALEVNPLRVLPRGQGVLALDGRVILS